MQWGISFKIKSAFDKELWGLPPPSAKRWLSKMDGTKILQVLYHFQYMPQSWTEWQRIASIKIQMKELIPQLIFNEYEIPNEVERVYTISELGKHFSKFVKFHRPLYPHSKDEYMRSLTLYCQRLYYERQFHYEAIVAMALHFNSTCELGYSHREVMKKAKSMLMLNTDRWKVKLNKDELQKAHSKGGLIAVSKKREKFRTKRDEALKLRESGNTLKQISEALDVSIITVKRWKLPKVQR
jgi:hypothetical protein